MKLIFRRTHGTTTSIGKRTDKKVLKRINQLISDIQRSPFEGIGKPDTALSGYWSRPHR